MDMQSIGSKIAAGFAAIFSLAVIAIIISTKANTSNVMGTFFLGLSNLIAVAISPITGQTVSGSAGVLSGNSGSWTIPVVTYSNSTSSTGTGSISSAINGVTGIVNSGTSLANSVNNLFGSTGGSGSGVVDTGSFDTGSSDISNVLSNIDSGTF